MKCGQNNPQRDILKIFYHMYDGDKIKLEQTVRDRLCSTKKYCPVFMPP